MNNLTPSEFYLCQNYPNPFKERTTIKFCAAYKTKVKLEVFNSEDKIIKILVDEEKEAGTYELNWNASNIPSGVYFYKLQAGSFLQTRKMILLK